MEDDMFKKQGRNISCAGITLVLLYVDDMIITDSDLDDISILKQDLNHYFEMKDLGTLSYFLELEVSTVSDGNYLSQAKYASDLLSRAGLTDSKTASTPLESNVRFTPRDGAPLRDPTLYSTLVGSLVYLTVTRPDIAYVVHLIPHLGPAEYERSRLPRNRRTVNRAYGMIIGAFLVAEQKIVKKLLDYLSDLGNYLVVRRKRLFDQMAVLQSMHPCEICRVLFLVKSGTNGFAKGSVVARIRGYHDIDKT
ncbi:hypothetical protein RJ639_040403 [Escallonia herrerae]|uniref:Reverse transcriptase Ty1/copia-type domain-containing protein n=1 Tax=Escallonia herrerae TaxID=1293975 RepID=A0AA88WGB9_9ASTE|nr:hypothetical protein RJ639_040403 [Escallonia herrerae]